MTTQSTHSPQVGDVIAGAYVLRERLGRGGMGVVYEAVLGTGETVAIKLLLEDHRDNVDAARRIRTEAVAARYISHVNVVSVLDFSEPRAPAPFLVMEHIRGGSLGSLIRDHGALPLRRAADIGAQILAGLDAAHAAGVVHADIKSDNVLLEAGETVKIIDFGLASIHRVDHPAPVVQYDHHGRQLTSGTPEYMAPEVIRGDGPVAQSDLYAVAIILYEMLTGKTPFATSSSDAIIERQLTESVVPPSFRRPDRFIPTELEGVVMRGLQKDPLRRYSSADAFAAALSAAAPKFEDRLEPFEHDPAAMSEATTRDFPTPARSLSRARCDEHVRGLRSRLRDALHRNAIDEVVVTSLELARMLVDTHDLSAAVHELEKILNSVENAPPAALTQLWRVSLTLAALYHGLGDTMRARRTAAAAHYQATLHRSDVGRDRASTLLQRLPHSRRRS
ncbi:MAG: serine/threonine-protein kinase [Kofleriaceae bacterium]